MTFVLLTVIIVLSGRVDFSGPGHLWWYISVLVGVLVRFVDDKLSNEVGYLLVLGYGDRSCL